MFHSKIKLFLVLAGSFLLFLFLACCCLFLYASPQHPTSVALFKTVYNLAPDKKYMLELYSPQKRGVSAGYIPSEVDQFLCKRIEDTTDNKEVLAIANFYSLQTGGREGACIYKVSDPAKEKMAAQLANDLDENPTLSGLYGKILLLEEIRQGTHFGKGGLSPNPPENNKRFTAEEWNKWMEKALPRAREKYKEWMNLNLNWEEKKKINPLEETSIKVFFCCG